MEHSEIRRLWHRAQQIDTTLRVSKEQLPILARRRLQPTSYSRDALFSAMARGQPVLFRDLAVPVKQEDRLGTREAVLKSLRSGFPRGQKVRVRCGPSVTEKLVRLQIDELLRRWEGNKQLVSVTDFHIRGSRVVRRMDCSLLSDFNLIANVRGDVGDQEMLTIVASSGGTYTDSHSDDPDGSNHCFVGKKLWLAWDTFEGSARNLEDSERFGYKGDVATFDLAAFLSIPGSRWFTVEAGQTLFLPGHLTHKVVTLEDYLGVGSFFVMLADYWRTLHRWTEHTPLWALKKPEHKRLILVDKITERVVRKVEALAHATAEEQSRWGYPYLVSAVEEWRRTASARSRRMMAANPATQRLLEAIPAAGSRTPELAAYSLAARSRQAHAPPALGNV